MDNTAPRSFAPVSTDRSWTFTVRGSERIESDQVVRPAKHHDPEIYAVLGALGLVGAVLLGIDGQGAGAWVCASMALFTFTLYAFSGRAYHVPAVVRRVARYERHVTSLRLDDRGLRIGGMDCPWSRLAGCRVDGQHLVIGFGGGAQITVHASHHDHDDLVWLSELVNSFVEEHASEATDARRVRQQARGLKRRAG